MILEEQQLIIENADMSNVKRGKKPFDHKIKVFNESDSTLKLISI